MGRYGQPDGGRGKRGGVVDLFDFIFRFVCVCKVIFDRNLCRSFDDQVLRHTMHRRKL